MPKLLKKKRKPPTEQHVKLRCLRCLGKATISVHLFDIAQQQGGAIACCFGSNGVMCGGTMTRFGAMVSRSRTLSQLPTYDWARQHALRLRRGAALRAEAAFDPDDVDDNEGTDDPDFVLSRDFNIAMRYTPEDMEAPRTVPMIMPVTMTSMTTDLVQTGNADFAERIKSTKTWSVSGKSAWRHAQDHGAPNAAAYRVGSLGHYEWCHLQGVCLGGKTRPENLVCGHFAVNTFMAAIEGVISGSGTQRRLRVTAWCQFPHVADWVHYEIFALNPKATTAIADIWIDGRITKFSQNDQTRVTDELKALGLG